MARQKTPPSITALEVSPRVAKLLVATTAPFRIQRLNASTLTEQTDDPVSALRALLESQLLGVSQVGLLFGREAFSLRTLELPSTNPKEIASMLELQLGKLTPYPRADILSGWTVIGSFRDGYTSVLLAVARKALIEGVLQLLKTKRITPQWVGVSTEGIASWSSQAAAREPAAPAEELTALIDVDFASTDCAILSQGRLLFSHSIAIGHEQLTGAEPATLRWVGELVRLPRILLHEEIKGRISRGVLTGVTHGLEPLVEQLTSQWGVGVEIKDSLAPFAPSPTVTQSAHATRVSYTALAGALASGTPPRIDLIPQEAKVSQALQVRSKHLARFAGSLVALLVLAGVLYLERIVILRHYLAQLQQRLAEVERTSHQVVQQQEAMQSIRAWLEPSHGALEILRTVTASVDPEITVTELSFKRNEPVTIEGKAGTMPAAFAFLDRLKQQGTFANVHARSVAKTRGASAVGADFEIVCDLPGSS